MPEYLSPGVYLEEIDTGNKPIEGVSTSTAGMLGVTERGPVDVPILITSYGEYRRWFGERLPLSDFFSPDTGPHCFLPHAVEGFFQNEGRRVYVTRVLDTLAAAHSVAELFDRGDASSVNTLLVRAAGEATGTAGNLPLLYVLDPTGLNAGDWVRIGDGSLAEYRKVATIGAAAANTHVPLRFALNFSHETGQVVWDFAGTAAPGYAGIFLAVGDLTAGEELIPLVGSAADISALVASSKQLLQIGDSNSEYHFVKQVIAVDSTHANVVLRTPLAIAHPANPKVSPLATPVPAAPPDVHHASLSLDANAGDALLFVDNRNGIFNVTSDLVLIAAVDADHTEVRGIGQLAQLTVSPGAFAAYPAGSIIDKMDLYDSPYLAADAIHPVNTITLDNASGIKKGDQLVLQPGLNQETVTVDSVAGNVVTLTANTANDHHALDSVTSPFSGKALTAAAPAGSRVLAVDDRMTLQAGDVVRIGAAPNDEYATIVSVPDRSAAVPDPGTVQIDHPLGKAHKTGDPVARQSPPKVNTAAAAPSTSLVLEQPIGGTQWLISDGEHYGDLPLRFVRVITPQGEIAYHRIAAAAVVTPVEVALATALERAHGAGSPFAVRSSLIDVEAIDPGRWGDRLRIAVEDEAPGLVSRTQLATIVNPTHVRLASVAGVEAGTLLELLDPLNNDAVVGGLIKVVAIDRTTNYTLTLAGTGLDAAQQAAQAAAVAVKKSLGV